MLEGVPWRELTMPTIRALGAALLFGVVVAPGAMAQEGSARVEGVARVAETGAPIPFALVHLLPADSRTAAPRQGITSADGRFHFAAAAPGEYRLQLLRIGYQPVLSLVLRLRPGETLQHELHGAMRPIELPGVVVRPARCLYGSQLAEDANLASLWNETRKGVELRRGFELRYGYTRLARYDHERAGREKDAPLWDRAEHLVGTMRVDTLVSTPDSVLPRERRLKVEGYGTRTYILVPTEKHLLDDDFLVDHCLELARSDDGHWVGLRFLPKRAHRNGGLAVRGTIWMDPATYLIQRVDMEHVTGRRLDQQLTAIRLVYGNVVIGGSSLQLAVGGEALYVELGLRQRIVLTYSGFEEARTP